MIPCMCFIQEGQMATGAQMSLRQKLDAFSRQAFNAPAQQTWIAVSKGNGFTEAKPSTSSLVSFQADAPLDQERRKELLSEICDIWMAETGCSLNEIVASINDPAI